MNKIRTAFVLAASLALTGVAFAQAKVVPAQSQITFAIKEMGVPVEGRFGQWTADIAFDPKKPETGKVAFTIATSSASFGSPETDAEVPKADVVQRRQVPERHVRIDGHQGQGRRQVRRRRQAERQGHHQGHRRADRADAGRPGHHRHRHVHHQAQRLQDRRRRVGGHVAARRRRAVKFKIVLTGVAPL